MIVLYFFIMLSVAIIPMWGIAEDIIGFIMEQFK